MAWTRKGKLYEAIEAGNDLFQAATDGVLEFGKLCGHGSHSRQGETGDLREHPPRVGAIGGRCGEPPSLRARIVAYTPCAGVQAIWCCVWFSRRSLATQAPWKPYGTREGTITRASGAAVMFFASTTIISDVPSISS